MQRLIPSISSCVMPCSRMPKNRLCADVQEEATAGSTKPAETVHYISITFFGTLLAGLDKKI